MAGKRGRPPGAAGKAVKLNPPLPGLRAARIAAGVSMADLGAAIGVNKSHMSKIELGQTRLDLGKAAILARALGITIDSMMESE